jgi:uncharacterized protein (UPF0548 family)
VEGYRRGCLDATPTCEPADEPPAGFRRDTFRRTLGTGSATFDRARRGIESWTAHRGAGVEVFPADAPIEAGETVAIVTRQLGLWVLAACRVVSVVDTPLTYGFTYVTLPDHPECGYESFTIRAEDETVVFEIEAVSRPGIAIVRLGAPITKELQRRASNAYISALELWTRAAS